MNLGHQDVGGIIVNIWSIKASTMIKKPAGIKASQKMQKPACTNASKNMMKKPESQQVKDKVAPFCFKDSESDQEQFTPGYIGDWNFVGPRGGYWSTDDPKTLDGPRRMFVQVRPGPEALLVATVVGIGGQR